MTHFIVFLRIPALILGVAFFSSGDSALDNCNSAKANVVSFVTANASNAPSTNTGLTLRFNADISGIWGYTFQFFFDITAYKLYWRGNTERGGHSWGVWKEI